MGRIRRRAVSELGEATRDNINERLAASRAVRAQFAGQHWMQHYCYLCDWVSNGRTLNEAIAANELHIRTEHPVEDANMSTAQLQFEEIRASLHDHDCDFQLCACKCGCKDGPFCTLVCGSLCSVCEVRTIRGDSEHGEATSGG